MPKNDKTKTMSCWAQRKCSAYFNVEPKKNVNVPSSSKSVQMCSNGVRWQFAVFDGKNAKKVAMKIPSYYRVWNFSKFSPCIHIVWHNVCFFKKNIYEIYWFTFQCFFSIFHYKQLLIFTFFVCVCSNQRQATTIQMPSFCFFNYYYIQLHVRWHNLDRAHDRQWVGGARKVNYQKKNKQNYVCCTFPLLSKIDGTRALFGHTVIATPPRTGQRERSKATNNNTFALYKCCRRVSGSAIPEI